MRGFTKFNFKLNLKVSAFYLKKQNSFIPKKKKKRRCQYRNKKALFTDPIFSEGFGPDFDIEFSVTCRAGICNRRNCPLLLAHIPPGLIPPTPSYLFSLGFGTYNLLHISTATSLIETVQDFLIKLDIKPLMRLLEISTFLLNVHNFGKSKIGHIFGK